MATIKLAGDMDEVGITQTIVHEHVGEGGTAAAVPATASGARRSPWSTAAFALFVVVAVGVIAREVIRTRETVSQQQGAGPEHLPELRPVQPSGNGVTIEMTAKGIVVKSRDRSASAASSAAAAPAASKAARVKTPSHARPQIQPPDLDPDAAVPIKPGNP